MYEHTTTQLAEYLGIQRQGINRYIRIGKLKATYKTKLNCEPRYYISHKEYMRFIDWHTRINKYSECGFAYKKTPNIDEYDLKPNEYNSYVSLKIQRNKSILEFKYLRRMKYKDIAFSFSVCIGSIKSIILKNKETNFVKELKNISGNFK